MKTHIITAISYMIMALIPAAVIYAVIHLDNIGNNRNYWNAI